MSEYITVWVDDLPDLKCGEKIVRCRDCRYADWLAVVGIGTLHCRYHGWTQTGNPDGFCAWAVKRDD